jgi:hypothetical protein
MLHPHDEVRGVGTSGYRCRVQFRLRQSAPAHERWSGVKEHAPAVQQCTQQVASSPVDHLGHDDLDRLGGGEFKNTK